MTLKPPKYFYKKRGFSYQRFFQLVKEHGITRYWSEERGHHLYDVDEWNEKTTDEQTIDTVSSE